VSSTILTLLVLPTLYAWVEERRLSRTATSEAVSRLHSGAAASERDPLRAS
jgi:hypothetical protein